MARRAKAGEQVSVHGFIRGLAIDAETGKVKKRFTTKNLVVNGGRDALCKLFNAAGSTSNVPTHAAVGTVTTAAAFTDSALGAEHSVARRSLTGTTGSTGIYSAAFSYTTTDANGSTLAELGLFNSNSGGIMLARATYGGIAKTTDMTLQFTYQLVFSS